MRSLNLENGSGAVVSFDRKLYGHYLEFVDSVNSPIQEIFPVFTTEQPEIATTQPLDCEMLDVVIMPQSSKSMPWGRVQNFMAEVAERLILHDNYAARVAVLTFGRQPRLEIGFDSYNGKEKKHHFCQSEMGNSAKVS